MAHTKETALRELNSYFSDKQIEEINEGFRIAYQSDSEEAGRMASVFFDYDKK